MAFEHHRLELRLAVGPDSLAVRRFSIHEALSELFSVSVVVQSPDHDVDLAAIVGGAGALRMTSGNPTQPTRVWGGLIAKGEQLHAEVSGGGQSQSSYFFRIVPELWRTTQRRNHRIFQQQSIVDTVKQLLDEWHIEASWRLLEAEQAYRKRDFTVQYGESDYAFICRLLEHAGITFLFAFEDGGPPKLVLTDRPTAGPARAGEPICAFDEPPPKPPAELVRRVRVARAVAPGAVTLRDYEFRRDYNTELLGRSAEKVEAPESYYEQYRYAPGEFVVDAGKPGSPATPAGDDRGIYPRHDEQEGAWQAELRLRALRKHRRVVRFETSCGDLAPGLVFQISGHPRDELAGERRLLSTRLSLEGAAEGEWIFAGEAAFTDCPWVPDRQTSKPVVLGMQSAVVVGPAGQEVHTDEHGRVRLQFHWDREGQYDEKSSCWVRVSQDWTGAGYGSFFLPRVGHEVLVAFYEGDPDQPVVVGRVYGELNKVPYELPKHKTRSTIKSDSSPKGDGLNEIMFEDARDQELFYLQAERDLDKLVNKYETERVAGASLSVVGQARQTVVGELEATMVGKRYLMQAMTKPSEGDLAIATQEPPKVSPTDTAVEMIDQRFIFTTGKATVALDGRNIRLEASGNVTLHAKGGDCLLEGKHTFINSKSPPGAPTPGSVPAVDAGTYHSDKADEVVALRPAGEQPLRQRTDDLDELFAEAAVADVNLRSATEQIAQRTGGEPMFPPGLKGRERSEEKIASDYGGDASQLLDLSRSSIVFDSQADIEAARDTICKEYEVVRIKDRFAKPVPGGYRDMLLNVKMPPDGHVCEVQLHSRQILEVKNGAGHKIYEQTRSIQAAAKKANRALSPQERQQIDQLMQRSEKIYGDAFAKFGGG